MRITCPECTTVLKPAKPIPAGKKVKCPKCGTSFTVEEEETEAAPAKVKAAPVPGAVKKKTAESAKAASKPEKPPEAPPKKGDDEEDGSAYSLSEDKDAKEGPAINYEPDKSIKDMRGPAQSLVIQPTNVLLGIGVGGFIGWIALVVILSIPVVFPIELDQGSKDSPKSILIFGRGLGSLSDPIFSGPASETKKEKGNVSLYQFLGYDFSTFALYPWYTFIFMMSPIGLGMCYSAIQTFGIVRAQNLESRQWGIAACIMAMIPFAISGLSLVICMFASFLLNMFLDETDMIENIVYGIATIIGLAQIAAGAHCLRVLMREDVIAGFEFVPDTEDVKVKKSKSKRKKQR